MNINGYVATKFYTFYGFLFLLFSKISYKNYFVKKGRFFKMSDEQTNTDQHVEAAVIKTDPMSKMNCAFCGAEIDIEGLPRFTPVACTACGKENSVSAKLGHFVLLKSLGSGGMGTVFLAEDENLGRKVAIKVMQKQLGQDPALFETFRNEAQSAARLNHPHVAQIYSFGREKGLPYLAMELVNGNKLDGMIESGTMLDPAFVLRVGLEIAEGLKAAEEVGLFHGDIKPDNILFDENMQAKLVDFGIASMASQGASSELWGTPYYIAPEKVQKKKNSARSDIYSLGATLYHAIAGQPPYEGPDAVAVIKARFNGPPPTLESIRPDIEPEVSRIIGRMMYNDLFMRYPNYGSLINDIKAYLANVPESRKAGPGKRQTVKNTAAVTPTSSLTIESATTPTGSRKSGKKFVITKGAMASSSATSAPPHPAVSPVATDPTQATASYSQINVNNNKPKNPNSAKYILFTIFGVVGLILLAVIGYVIHIIIKNNDLKKEFTRVNIEIAELETTFEGLNEDVNHQLELLKQRDAQIADILTGVSEVYKNAADITPIFPDFEPPKPVEPTEEASDGESVVAPTEFTEEQLATAKQDLIDLGITEPSEDQIKNMASKKFATTAPAAEAPAANPLAGKTIETITAKLITENPELAKIVAEKILTEGMKRKARTALMDLKGEEPTDEEIIKRAISTIGKDIPAKLAELDETDKEAINAAINAAAGAAGAEVAEAAAEPEPEAPAEEESAPAEDDSKAKIRATLDASAEQNIYVYAKEIRKLLRDAEALAQKATSYEPTPYDAKKANIRTLNTIRDNRAEIKLNLQQASKTILNSVKAADVALRNMKVGIKKLQKDARGFIAQKKRLEEEARIAREAAEEETRRVAAEAKRQAVIREEIDRINSVLADKKPIIDKFEYQKVINDMKRMEAELSTPEAKEELEFVVKRFEKLISLREFILNDLDKNAGLRRGYRRLDISGISKDRKTIYAKPNKEIPVSSLTYSDWQNLLINLVIRRDGNRTISFQDEATQLFNAAIFCYVHDSGNTIADQIMRECATKAIKKQASLSSDARRLIPALTQEEIDAIVNTSSDDDFSADGF